MPWRRLLLADLSAADFAGSGKNRLRYLLKPFLKVTIYRMTTGKNRSPCLRFLQFFRSIRLVIVLIVYIGGYLIVASLLPGPLVPEGLFGFILIYLPLSLFFLNLSFCTVSRIHAKIRAGTYRELRGLFAAGPDFIHLALLLFIVGGLILMLPGISAVLFGKIREVLHE